MAVTLKQIAEKCNLSRSTVRNILASQDQGYAPATRERVRATAREMGYRPNRLPGLLRGPYSEAVGIFVSSLNEPYFAELLDMLTRTIPALGLEVMVGVPHTGDDSLRRFLSWRLRALVVVAVPDSLTEARLNRLTRSTAVVTVNCNPFSQCPAVFPDRDRMIELAVKHLLDLGHRRIGFATSAEQKDIPKVKSLARHLAHAGLLLDDRDVCTGSLQNRPVLATQTDRPTAIICENELIANGFITDTLAAGRKIPDDLAVVTCNQTDFGQNFAMPITRVGVPMNTYCQSVVDFIRTVLDQRDNGRHITDHVALEPVLIPGESTLGRTSDPSSYGKSVSINDEPTELCLERNCHEQTSLHSD